MTTTQSGSTDSGPQLQNCQPVGRHDLRRCNMFSSTLLTRWTPTANGMAAIATNFNLVHVIAGVAAAGPSPRREAFDLIARAKPQRGHAAFAPTSCNAPGVDHGL